MNGQARIEQVFAWVCTDKNDGTEGIPCMKVDDNLIPMSTTRRDLIEQMRPIAEDLRADGHKMALVEFSARITHEVLP